MRCLLVLLMLTTCGCAATAPLGTGSAVADIFLGGVIHGAAVEMAPKALAMAGGGLDRLAGFGGNPRWADLIPGRQPKVRYINGMTFVGDGW